MLFQNDRWYFLWLATVVFLTAGVLSWETGFLTAIAITIFNFALALAEEKKITAFPVQLRLVFLGMLCLFYLEPFRPLYLIPIAGTLTVIFTGYCLLARVLVLMPWNRREPLTADLMKRTFFSPPVKGSILPEK